MDTKPTRFMVVFVSGCTFSVWVSLLTKLLLFYAKFLQNFETSNATPNHQDLSLKIDLPTSKKGKISIFSIAGESDVGSWRNEEYTTKSKLSGLAARKFRKVICLNTQNN